MADNWFQQNAPKKDESTGGNWFTKNAPSAGPGIAPDDKSGFVPQATKAVGTIASEAANFGTGLLELTPPMMAYRGIQRAVQEAKNPEGAKAQSQESLEGLKEIVKRPLRELAGRTQPGQPPESAPSSMLERLTGAFSAVMGGDPSQERILKNQGFTAAAIAAGWTQPLLSAGLGALLKLPESTRARAAKLTAATGTSQAADIPLSYRQVIPRLDEVVKDSKQFPTSPKELQAVVGGNPVNFNDPASVAAYKKFQGGAFRKMENEFNFALQPIAGQETVPTSVADRIRKLKKAATQSAANREFNEIIENRAVEFDQKWNYQQLNEHRMDLFRKARTPIAERIGLKTEAQYAADKAAMEEIRDIVYKEMERNAGKPGAYSKLKADEAALFGIKDQLESQIKKLSGEQAMREGTSAIEAGHLSGYVHPSGGGGMSLHRIPELLPGMGPEERAGRKITRVFKGPGPIRATAGAVKRGAVIGSAVKSQEGRKDKSEAASPPITPEQWAQ